jgi:FkbM family methyltransferase
MARINETKLVQHLLKDRPGRGLMLDVGAHRGASLQSFVRAGWRVYAFEPDICNRRELVNWLQRNLQPRNATESIKLDMDKHAAGQILHFKRHLADGRIDPLVTVDDRAVSNTEQEAMPFYFSYESSGISGLAAFTEKHDTFGSVAVTTLTEAINRYGIEKVDFLKIDTEGYDFMVLQGYPWDSKPAPLAVECEFEDSKSVPLGYTYKDMADFLVERGYTVYVSEWHPIVRYGLPHEWRGFTQYPCELHNPDAWGNLIAFQQPPTPATLEAALRATVELRNPAAAAQAQASTPEQAARRASMPPLKRLRYQVRLRTRIRKFLEG